MSLSLPLTPLLMAGVTLFPYGLAGALQGAATARATCGKRLPTGGYARVKAVLLLLAGVAGAVTGATVAVLAAALVLGCWLAIPAGVLYLFDISETSAGWLMVSVLWLAQLVGIGVPLNFVRANAPLPPWPFWLSAFVGFYVLMIAIFAA